MKVGIVGAGPAGSYLAYMLAGLGAKVLLYDGRGAWEKPCGGGVPPKVHQMFPEIRVMDAPRREVSVGVFVSPEGREVRLESRNPLWVVARKDFNGYLLDLARGEKGVTFRKRRVARVRRLRTRWMISGKDFEDRVDRIVGADGANSLVRRAVAEAIPREMIAGTMGYFVERKDEREAVSRFLDAPGYIWAFPRTDHICVGGGTCQKGYPIRQRVDAFVAERFAGRKVLGRWAAPIPFIRDPSFFDRPVSGDGWFLVGDAAGHVDPITGEGILYAMWGAKLLAKALAHDGDAPYEELWRDAYGGELLRAVRMSGSFYAPGAMEWVFRVAMRSRTLREFLMDIMTDQPSYLAAAWNFRRRIPRILLEFAGLLR